MPASDTQKFPLARKVAIAVASGVGGYLAANTVSPQVAFQVGASFFVAGVTFVLTYLVEVDQRLTGVEHSTRTSFAKINPATTLYAHIEESKIDTDVVTALVENVIQIDPETRPLVFKFVQAEINRLSDLVREVSAGSDSVHDGEDRDWILTLTQNCSKSIDAVSLTTVDSGVDSRLWEDDLGLRYLELQRQAKGRGVIIRRLFMVQVPSLLASPDLLSICGRHKQMGVDVRLLDLAVAPGTSSRSMVDFIVFDGALSYEFTPGGHQTPTGLTRIVHRPSAVRARVDRFNELWEAASDPASQQSAG